MPVADRKSYLADVVNDLKLQWPDNSLINFVCHGHSVPAGYFANAVVDTFNAYPHLFHRGLKERFPFAVTNVIVTAIGGESSDSGAARLETDVLRHGARVVTIDYALNDRRIGLPDAKSAWRSMIERLLDSGIRPILLTPTPDTSGFEDDNSEQWTLLHEHADQIRALAGEYEVALADSFSACDEYIRSGGDLTDLLSSSNHPNRKGHEIVAREILRWFYSGTV